jgi:DNA-binding response OmpR family regulator
MNAGRIMVVDDDQALLGFTTKYLSRLGYSVAAYRSSEEAWRQFSAPAANYALIVVDLSLPVLSGEELASMMLDANPEVRLIITSGYPFDPARRFDSGGDRVAFLHKPFAPSMLTETIDRLLGC